MSILTKSQFSTVAKQKAGYKGLSGVINENKQFSRATQLTSIFLSHSHTDKDVVEQAVSFFRNFGITVYIDWFEKLKSSKDIFEFRVKDSNKFFRLFAFWDSQGDKETIIVCTHGLIKKTNKTPKQDIEKAEII
jgi:phage-related protein